MKKFFKWMEQKRYDEDYPGVVCCLPQQCLIGYMMEYLNDVSWKWWFSDWDEQTTTEERYRWLEAKININEMETGGKK